MGSPERNDRLNSGEQIDQYSLGLLGLSKRRRLFLSLLILCLSSQWLAIEGVVQQRPEESSRIKAETIFAEGEQLRHQETKESLQRAVEKHGHALQLFRSAGDRPGEAKAHQGIGLAHESLGNPKEAVTHFKLALSLFQSLGDRPGEAKALSSLGSSYIALGELEKGIEQSNLALSLFRNLSDRRNQAAMLSQLAAAYFSLGEMQTAIDNYNQALVHFRELGDREEEGRALSGLGRTYDNWGKHEKALAYYDQALPLRRAAGDRSGEAFTLHNLGFHYVSLGEYQKALDYFTQAVEIRRALGDRRNEAYSLGKMGISRHGLGDQQKAIDYQNQALALFRTVGDRRGEAITLFEMTRADKALNQPEKALQHLNQALALYRGMKDRLGELQTLHEMGSTYRQLANPARAMEFFQQALELSRSTADRRMENFVLYGIAQVDYDLGRYPEALRRVQEVIAFVESKRATFGNEAMRASYFAFHRESYGFYIKLLLKLHQSQPSAGHAAAALEASERSHARGLLDLLTESKVDVSQGIDPALTERGAETHARVSRIQFQLIKAHAATSPDGNRILQLKEEFSHVERESEQLERDIRRSHPRYADLQYPEPIQLDRMRQLLGNHSLLLEYSVSEQGSFLFALTQDNLQVARLPSGWLLADRVKKLRTATAQRSRASLTEYRAQARQLYKDLIQPVEPLLVEKKELIIVPDGILHYLPFEVLLRSDGPSDHPTDLGQLPYLVKDVAIRYAPSASVLASLSRHLDKAPGPSKKLFACADPVYGRERDLEGASPVGMADRSIFGDPSLWRLRRLKQTRREVERIAEFYPKEEVTLLQRENAREETVKLEDLSQYRILHFAVHGLLNESDPKRSGLVLTLPSEKGSDPMSQEDGLLQVHEIFGLKLRADLVVLSGCETGLGKQVKGEGVLGLTRAFLYAGTSSVVVSLWKVDDLSTAELMARFYRFMEKEKLPKAEALRQAQLELIREGRFAHPFFWAPFVLVGDS